MGKQILLASAGALLFVGVFLLGFIKRMRATRTLGTLSLALGVVGLGVYAYVDIIAPGLVDKEKETVRQTIFAKTGKYPDKIELKMKWPPRTPNIRDFAGVAHVGAEEFEVWVIRKDVAGESKYYSGIGTPDQDDSADAAPETAETRPATTQAAEPLAK